MKKSRRTIEDKYSIHIDYTPNTLILRFTALYYYPSLYKAALSSLLEGHFRYTSHEKFYQPTPLFSVPTPESFIFR